MFMKETDVAFHDLNSFVYVFEEIIFSVFFFKKIKYL